MATPDAATAHVRFVLLRHLPMVVVDLEPPPEASAEPGLFTTLVERGMVVVPRFYGLDLPRGVRVGFTLTADELLLEDEDETRLLRAPRGAVPADWEAAAKRLKGTMLLVGRQLGVDPDESPQALCDRLELSAREKRVAGAIVGVAEPTTTLPLFH